VRELVRNFYWGLTGERQSMLVAAGRVEWRRSAQAQDACIPANVEIDMAGRFLLPGFVDAHCHILPAGLASRSLDLEMCTTREQILDALRDRDAALPAEEWLHAVHYDQNRLPGGGHLHRNDLDSISAGRPILVRHVSGHGGVANSAALSAAKVEDDIANSLGGKHARDASGHLTGLLSASAWDRVEAAAPKANVEQMVEAIMAAGDLMARRGITCAADMMTGYADLADELTAYRLAAERGCAVRLRLYVLWSRVLGPRPLAPERLDALLRGMDGATCRVAGLKVFADGALSSRTAAIYGAYENSEAEHSETWSGNLVYKPERLAEMLCKADDAGYQVATHTIGDYATDCVLDALDRLEQPARHRLEHAMLLDDRQVDRLAKLGVPCSVQPEFLLRLKDAYVRSLGVDRTAKLSRTRSLLRAGVGVGFSSDKPVVEGDPWDGVAAATDRPDGFDPSENLSITEALEAYTCGAADLCGDKGLIGRLNAGEWADYQVYDADPRSARAPRPIEVRLGRP
jgi:hypothetical protein